MKVLGEVNGSRLIVKNEDGKYVYYLGEQEIGGFSPKVTDVKIIFRENTKENELSAEIKDKVKNIVDKTDKNEIMQTTQDYTKTQVEQIERSFRDEGILKEDEKIKRISIMDVNKKGQQSLNMQNSLENSRQEEIKRKQRESDVSNLNIKQKMKVNDKATDMKTVGQLFESAGKFPKLDKNDGEITHVGIIESDDLKKLSDKNGKRLDRNTTRYSMAAITNEGKAIPMQMEQDHQEGNNPLEQNYQVKQNEDVEKDDVLSRFKLGDGTISIKNGQYGEIEVYHSPRKTIGGNGVEGNKSLDIQLPTNNVWEMDKDERDLAGEYKTGYRSVEDSYQEAKKHERDDCEEIEPKDIDGKEDTKSHNHISNEELDRYADEILETEVIDDVFTKNEVKESLIKAMETNKHSMNMEQLKEKVKEEMELDAEMLKRRDR